MGGKFVNIVLKTLEKLEENKPKPAAEPVEQPVDLEELERVRKKINERMKQRKEEQSNASKSPDQSEDDQSDNNELTKFFQSIDQDKLQHAAEAALVGAGLAASMTEAAGSAATFVGALETISPLLLILL